MEDINKLIEKMRKADKRSEELNETLKPNKSPLTDKQKYIRGLKGGMRK